MSTRASSTRWARASLGHPVGDKVGAVPVTYGAGLVKRVRALTPDGIAQSRPGTGGERSSSSWARRIATLGTSKPNLK